MAACDSKLTLHLYIALLLSLWSSEFLTGYSHIFFFSNSIWSIAFLMYFFPLKKIFTIVHLIIAFVLSSLYFYSGISIFYTTGYYRSVKVSWIHSNSLWFSYNCCSFIILLSSLWFKEGSHNLSKSRQSPQQWAVIITSFKSLVELGSVSLSSYGCGFRDTLLQALPWCSSIECSLCLTCPP